MIGLEKRESKKVLPSLETSGWTSAFNRTLPAFVSKNVLNFLVENYNISPISTPEEDLKKILG